MQIDIGFGDIIYPKPEKMKFPTMLDFPSYEILCYSKESVIAEKFEAMIKLGIINSRMKDFYNIWLLSGQFQFEFSTLSKGIKYTFKQRGTKISSTIEVFTPDFKEKIEKAKIKLKKAIQLKKEKEKEKACKLKEENEFRKKIGGRKHIYLGFNFSSGVNVGLDFSPGVGFGFLQQILETTTILVLLLT